jgi:hypothetical protein
VYSESHDAGPCALLILSIRIAICRERHVGYVMRLRAPRSLLCHSAEQRVEAPLARMAM